MAALKRAIEEPGRGAVGEVQPCVIALNLAGVRNKCGVHKIVIHALVGETRRSLSLGQARNGWECKEALGGLGKTSGKFCGGVTAERGRVSSSFHGRGRRVHGAFNSTVRVL